MWACGEHINIWMGKELILLLSIPYLYIPIAFIWFSIIFRNNNLKNCLIIVGSIGVALLSIIVCDMYFPMEPIFPSHSSNIYIALVVLLVIFSLLLFRSRTFAFVILLMTALLICVLLDFLILHIYELLLGIINAIIFYMLFLILRKRLSSSQTTWITNQYTNSGYAVTNMYLLNNILILTAFLMLILLLHEKCIA